MKDRGKVTWDKNEDPCEAIIRGKRRLEKDKLAPGFPVGYCSCLCNDRRLSSSSVDYFFIVYGKMSGSVKRRARFLVEFVDDIIPN